MLSGVPQGSVLGPLLFLIFICELPDWIKCNMKMFADDTKVWKRIGAVEDGEELQRDLDTMMEWSDEWLLRFNLEKCKVMHVGHQFDTVYSLEGSNGKQLLETISKERDLGVIFTRDLKAASQCVKAAAKAHSVTGLVRRHFKRLDRDDFMLLYKSYIRPQVEYCIQSWSPYLLKDIECLERVQRRATKLVSGFKNLEYEERLRRLGLTTLEKRRARGILLRLISC